MKVCLYVNCHQRLSPNCHQTDYKVSSFKDINKVEIKFVYLSFSKCDFNQQSFIQQYFILICDTANSIVHTKTVSSINIQYFGTSLLFENPTATFKFKKKERGF